MFNKRIFAGVLSLALLLAIVAPASAQWRRRDRGFSTGQKVAIIGGGAAAGAVIGGLLGGTKGAVIGGVVGAGGGTGAVLIRNHQADEHNEHLRDWRYREYREDRYRDYRWNNRWNNRWHR